MLGLSLLLYLIVNVAFGQTQFAGSSCNEGLGMQNYWIQNADITASSIRDIFHDPGKARLHGNSAWMPSAQNEEQFLQIYFKGGTNVSAVAFQGHPNYEYWVTRYKLSFSLDGKTWEELSEVFTLVRDNKDEVITSQLPELKNVRFMRVYPTEWYGAIAIRMEIYGCMKEFANCGNRVLTNHHSRQKRIVGGKVAEPHSWPWQVEIIENGTKHFCSGSIIHPQWILTAAHCADPFYSTTVKEIRLGEHNRVKLEGYEEIMEGNRYYIHPGFKIDRPTAESPGDYDMALYHLKRPAIFYSKVSPVCLPHEDSTVPEDIGRMCFVTGWGHSVENGTYSEVLQENQVPIVSRQECNKEESYNGKVHERYLCAGYQEGGMDACQGDSGGPLVCQDGAGKWVLAGVVTWGEGCARPHKYGVYADVRRFLPFIESTIYGYPKCGIRPVQSQISRIIGGREARPNSWPWQVDLLVNGTAHGCGGSLIGSSWVVTSGHCFFLYDKPSQWQIRVGEHNESKFEGYEEKIDIENITIHPGFQLGSKNYTGDYDIAIIKLKRPAVFHKRVHSICLPDMETSFSAGKTCFATGWGKQQENASAYSEVLREVEVNLVSKEVCNSNISYRGGINERYFCAGFPEGGKDACYGDSGGPLACQKEDGSFVLTGVVSWGTGCARANKYGVYLDVRYMLPFIESVITGFRPECGTRFIPSSSSLMVSGHDARPNSWPWQVELLFLNTHACSGTLIDGFWILTSADCVNARGKPENWTARVGEHDRTVLEGYEEIIGVKNIVVSLKRHIALMKLERMAVLHRRVSPICLPNEGTEFVNGSLCYVIGWRSIDKQGNISNKLKEAQVKLDSTKLCNSSFNGTISKYERCASSVRNEDQICNVDGGAPLVCPRGDGKFALAGVANSRDWCTNPGQHGVFIDVKSMLSFIHNAVTVAADIMSA